LALGIIIVVESTKQALKMNIKRTRLLALAILLPCVLFSQEFIQGRLLDSVSKAPVVFANILLEGSSKGVISNEDGSFRIPMEFKSEYEGLLISSLGYESVSVAMDALSEDRLNTIYLTPRTIALQETTVVGYTKRSLAKRIVRKAIRAIPRNFSKDPFSLVGYYRDYQQDERTYLNLNESIVEVRDEGFHKSDAKTTKYQIYRLVKNMDFPRDSISSMSYDYENQNKVIAQGFLPSYNGNELVILRVHDAVRNYDIDSYSFVNNLRRDFVHNHDFQMGSDVYLDGEWLYSVLFDTYKENVRAKGRIIISKTDYSIYGLDYAAYEWNKKKEGSEPSNEDSSRMIFHIQSEYRPYQGKMFLNYLSFSNRFVVRLSPAFMLKNITIDTNNKITWLEFNNPVNISSTLDKEHYEVFFRKKKLAFELLKGHEEEDKVFIRPIFTSEKDETAYFSNDREAIKKRMVYKVKGLMDVYGNMLGHSEQKEYLQYREFFTQRILQGNDGDENGVPMEKERPLFDHVVTDESVEAVQDYWMNTPLQEANDPPE
jgi:hypothetical protein